MSLGFKVLKAFKSRGYKVLDIADEVIDSEIAGIIEIEAMDEIKRLKTILAAVVEDSNQLTRACSPNVAREAFMAMAE